MNKLNKINQDTFIPDEVIEKNIYVLRNQKVMLDFNLASLYNVETKVLKRAVKRNIDRFPEDFMFRLNREELEKWRCQFGTSKSFKMGLRYLPMAFTEQGVSMLSSVLRSKHAVKVNIEIMRTFVKMRKIILSHEDLERKIAALEFRFETKFKIVFKALEELMKPPEKAANELGFKVKERKVKYLSKQK
jgi:hypothetical protein